MKYGYVLRMHHNEMSDEEILEYNVDQARMAEQYKFYSVLLSSQPQTFDLWLIANKICEETKNLKLLVAQNSNHLLPSYVARTVNSYNKIFNNRIDINIVSGTSRNYVQTDSKFHDHETRYKITKEFAELFRTLMYSDSKPISYNGDFFSIEETILFPNCSPPEIFISGSSIGALEIASSYSDYYLTFPSSINSLEQNFVEAKQLAQTKNRKIKCGSVINIITAKNKSEAWEKANNLLNSRSIQDKAKSLIYLHRSDSIGMSNLKELLKKKDNIIDNHLWSGFSYISPHPGLSIVGSYTDTIDTIHRMEEAGVEYLLFTTANDNDYHSLGEFIMPRL